MKEDLGSHAVTVKLSIPTPFEVICFVSWILYMRFLSRLGLYAYLSVKIQMSTWQSLRLAFSWSIKGC